MKPSEPGSLVSPELRRLIHDTLKSHVPTFSMSCPTGIAFDARAYGLEHALEKRIPQLGSASHLFKWHSPDHVRVPAVHLSYSTEFMGTIVVGLLTVPRGRDYAVQDFHTLSTGDADPRHFTGVADWMRPELGTVRSISEFNAFASGGAYGGLVDGHVADHHKRATASAFPDPAVLKRVLDAVERANRR